MKYCPCPRCRPEPVTVEACAWPTNVLPKDRERLPNPNTCVGHGRYILHDLVDPPRRFIDGPMPDSVRVRARVFALRKWAYCGRHGQLFYFYDWQCISS